MDFDDPRWNGLLGAYKTPYDPRSALKSLERGGTSDAAWTELWSELYQRGNVGEASYAAIPHLVRIHVGRRPPDWNTYALAATIERARVRAVNPEVPPWLRDAYDSAWRRLVELGLEELRDAEEERLVGSILAVVCLAKKQFNLALMALLDEEELREVLDVAGWGYTTSPARG